jgi:hypothetical protein
VSVSDEIERLGLKFLLPFGGAKAMVLAVLDILEVSACTHCGAAIRAKRAEITAVCEPSHCMLNADPG